MTFGFQDAAALALAALALGWLVVRRLKRRHGGPACEGCPAATAKPESTGSDFVPLGDLAPRAPRTPRAPR